MLTKEEIEMIRMEANPYTKLSMKEVMGSDGPFFEFVEKAYIAGATAEREKAKVLVEALELIVRGLGGLGGSVLSGVVSISSKALTTYNK